jgi:hypothetical protein
MRSLLLGILLSFSACDDDMVAVDPACEAIHDACAAFQGAGGPGHDCDKTAETNNAAQCMAQSAECLAFCNGDMSVPADLSVKD